MIIFTKRDISSSKCSIKDAEEEQGVQASGPTHHFSSFEYVYCLISFSKLFKSLEKLAPFYIIVRQGDQMLSPSFKKKLNEKKVLLITHLKVLLGASGGGMFWHCISLFYFPIAEGNLK